MTLAHPAWLIALILLPLIGVAAVIAARMRGKQWSSLVAERLRKALIQSGSPIPRWVALAFLVAATAAIIIGLSRPQADAGTRAETTVGRNLLIALDLSRSMRVPDVKPDRLSNAKLVIYELLDALPNERIGLIGFAGSAYLYAPLTVDHQAVRETAEQMDENWPTVGGSDLQAAVKLAISTLQKTGQKNNALVIISDGEKHGGDVGDMIASAKNAGVYIITIGVGTEDGDYVPNPDFPGDRMIGRDGTPVISRLHADALRKLAAETRGTYAAADSGADIPSMIQSAIAGLDTYEMEGKERQVMVEFYQWLTLPAILFLTASLICGTRWRGVHTAILIGSGFLFPLQAKADLVHHAHQALAEEHYSQAQELYQRLASKSLVHERKASYRLGEATAAYRNGDFKQARHAYSQAILSKDSKLQSVGHLGLGNSLFQLGWQTLAQEAYPTEPSKFPDLEQFDRKVTHLLNELRDRDPDDTANGGRRIESMISNWTDAIRHYDSTLDYQPTNNAARHNRKMTLIYLKRLAELLEQDRRQTEQMIPPPLPDPQEQDENGQKEPQKNPQGDEGDQQDPNSANGDEESEQPPEQGENEDEDSPEKSGSQDEENANEKNHANETPEEKARRILKENADLEKGPLTPGYREFQKPEKDW